jgi:hypothetical protein
VKKPKRITRAMEQQAEIRLFRLVAAGVGEEMVLEMSPTEICAAYKNAFNATLNLESCDLIHAAAWNETWPESKKAIAKLDNVKAMIERDRSCAF